MLWMLDSSRILPTSFLRNIHHRPSLIHSSYSQSRIIVHLDLTKFFWGAVMIGMSFVRNLS